MLSWFNRTANRCMGLETVLASLFPKKIHAVAPRGFELKIVWSPGFGAPNIIFILTDD